MQTPRLGSSGFEEPALAVYLSPLAASRRVLWVGPREGGGPQRLAALGADVLVAQPAEPAMAREGTDGLVRWRRWEGERLPLGEQERFDLVVALAPVSSSLLDALECALSPTGLLVLGVEGEGEAREATVLDLHRRLGRRFPRVAVVGQAPFHALAIARLGEPPGDDVVVDGGLLQEREPEPPRRIFVVAGAHWPEELSSYELVAVPGAASPPERTGRPAEEATPTDGEEHGPARESGRDGSARWEVAEREVARLEALLAERAVEARRLREEVARRGRLVRDLAERIAELGEGAPAGGPADAQASDLVEQARERALQAEARAEAARFEADELRGRLREALSGEVEARLAKLEGEARGWRARAAELRELHESAEARLRLAEADLRLREGEIQRLQRELQQALERHEAELARARAMEAAEAREGEQLAGLRGEVVGLRMRLADREEALRSWRARAESMQRAAEALEDRLRERESALQERAALVTRLQLELADEEKRTQALTRRNRQLEEEVARLREAVVEAAERAPAVDPEAAARLEELERQLQAAREAAEAERRERAKLQAALRRARGELEAAETEAARLRTELGAVETARAALQGRLEGAERARRRLEEEQGYLEERLRRAEEERRELKVRLQSLSEQLEEARGAAREAEPGAGAEAELEALRSELSEVRSERDRLRDAVDRLRREQAERASQRERLEAAVAEARAEVEAARAERDALRETLRQLREELQAVALPAGERAAASITAVGMEAPGSGEEPLRERLEALERELRDHRTLVETLTAQIEERDQRIRELRRRAEEQGAERGSDALRRELLAVQSRLARLQEELELEREARRAAEAASTAGGIPSPAQMDARRQAREALDAVEELLREARERGERETARRLGELLELLASL